MRNYLKKIRFKLGLLMLSLVSLAQASEWAQTPSPQSLRLSDYAVAVARSGGFTPKPPFSGETFGRHRIASLDEGDSKGDVEPVSEFDEIVLIPDHVKPASLTMGSLTRGETLESAQSLTRDSGSNSAHGEAVGPIKIDPYARLKKELVIEKMGEDGWRYPLTRAERAIVLGKLESIPGIEEFLRPNRFTSKVSKTLILNFKTNDQLKDLSKIADEPAKNRSIHLNYIYVGDEDGQQNLMLTDRDSQTLYDINGGILD